jgi:RNase P subunit RPR2
MGCRKFPIEYLFCRQCNERLFMKDYAADARNESVTIKCAKCGLIDFFMLEQTHLMNYTTHLNKHMG